MVVGHLNEDDPQPVGILYPHLEEAPRLLPRVAQNLDAGRGQAPVLCPHVSDLVGPKNLGPVILLGSA